MPPIRRSALFHAHQQAGAGFTEHHGWQVPERFAGAQQEAEQLMTNAALGDVSWTAKLDLIAKPDVKDGRVSTSLVSSSSSGRVWALGRRHFLITCDPDESGAALAQLPPGAMSVTDVSSVYAQLLLAGPRSLEILRKLTSLSVRGLQNLDCGQASLAHVHSIILRDDMRGVPAFHILVSREYSESVWHAILHAGHEYHLSPFGLQALKLVGGVQA